MLEHQTQSEQIQTEVKQNKKKRTSKKSTLVLTDNIKEKVSESLRQMISEVKDNKQQKPAEILIKENMEFIDKLLSEGVSMKQIFFRINNLVKLGISPASFAVYVRRAKQKFQCKFCETEAVLIDTSEFSDLKIMIWGCQKCGAFYKSKKNKISLERISKKVELKIRQDFAKKPA